MSDQVKATGESESAEADHGVRFVPFVRNDRVELVATVVLSIAAILTAWSVFQGSKWGGIEAFQLAEASAARTESVRADNIANEQALTDITMFDNWLLALQEDVDAGLIHTDDPLDAHPGAISSFFYRHMREEFKPAIAAWAATDPFGSVGVEDLSQLPYEMDEYQLAARQEAIELGLVAEGHVEDAYESNGNSDAYVFAAVLFAVVLFFAAVSGKMDYRRNRFIVLTFGVLVLIGTLIFLISLPMEL
jgi:hypothetical protein